MEDEIWMPVPSYPGVMASSWGRIKTPDRQARMPHGNIRDYKTKPTFGHVTKASKTARHSYMGLCSKFYGNIKIHRAICEAFHGPAPEGKPYVLHADENAHNNRPENLSWGSQKENLNAKGFVEYCKSRTGANSPATKSKTRGSRLTPDDVEAIRKRIGSETLSSIASDYGCSVASIHHIKSGKTHSQKEPTQ